MDTHQGNQHGFSPLVTILIIAVIVVGGVIGWRVWETNKATQQNNRTQGNSQQSTNPNTDPNDGYVVIKEWGVRFKPVEGLEGVVYVMRQRNPNVSFDEVVFTTKKLSDFGPACAGQLSSHAPLGSLFRFTQPQTEFHDESGEFIKRIGDYYYRYSPPQSACLGSDEAANLGLSLLQSFKPSIATVESAK